MAFKENPKTGLPQVIDLDDTTWTTKLLTGFNNLEARMGKTTNADPNGAVAGEWYGQNCWSTGQGVLYECIKPGPATGATRAVWQPSGGVAPGTIAEFWRTTVPTGWLPMSGGLYTATAYPNLFAVLPSGVTKTATNFTLPNLRGGILFRRYPDGSEPVDDIGAVVSSANLLAGTGGTVLSYRVMNVLVGIKF